MTAADEESGRGRLGQRGGARLCRAASPRRIADWIRNPFMLGEGAKRRPVRPEDILVLVRRRGDLASLIVARLHAEGVPVAGVDRLALSAPLAVQDLLAAARFAVQPLDDLNLGALLVSPLFGWTQDELFAASFRREGSAWLHIRGEKLQFEANPQLLSDDPRRPPRAAPPWRIMPPPTPSSRRS